MKVKKLIERGAFGRVEEVILDDGSVVARKTFDPALDIRKAIDRNKLIARFKREVRAHVP